MEHYLWSVVEVRLVVMETIADAMGSVRYIARLEMMYLTGYACIP